jgi:hypothetical protein
MRLLRVLLILLLFPALLAGVAGWFVAPAFLHPTRRVLTPDLIREADAAFLHVGGRREDFNVRASDGSLLRGWKVRAANANGAWVLAFHGVGDNRIGVVNHSEILLRAGYSVVLMDLFSSTRLYYKYSNYTKSYYGEGCTRLEHRPVHLPRVPALSRSAQEQSQHPFALRADCQHSGLGLN